MMGRVRKYYTVFKIVFQDSLQYRFNAVSGWLVQLFTLIAPLALWSAIFSERSEISGYDFKRMITYIFVVTFLHKVILADGVHFTVAQDIREGKISSFLFKPMDYRWFIFANSLGRRVFQLVVTLIFLIGTMIILIFFDYFYGVAIYLNLVYFLLSVVQAIVLSFLIYFSLGIIAFWMVECSALYITLGTALFFLSGGLFPLDLFDGLKGLFMVLPFQYQLYFPLTIFLGGLSTQELWIGLGIQFIWILLMLSITNMLWSKGLRKYTAVGG